MLAMEVAAPFKGNVSFHILGHRQKEIRNHLRNVIATVSDKKNCRFLPVFRVF
jgi:hypothetical protein